MAIKRKAGKELTPKEKEYNKALSSVRIRVEHTIIFRVMGDRYRNSRHKYEIINNIVYRLVSMLLAVGTGGNVVA